MTYGKEALRGRFIPKKASKYVGDVKNIIYRSSLELKFMHWCDRNDAIIQWNSEEVVVPYRSPKDDLFHRYYVDFVIKVKTASGEEKVHLVEVKPSRYTVPPKPPKTRTKSFLSEVVQWGVNSAKWDAARIFAKSKGWNFILITEKDLSP